MDDKDAIMDQYYQEHIVTALIGAKVDTKHVDEIARSLVDVNNVEDIFLVTGEYDIIIKVKFPSYGALKNFILETVSHLNGVMKTETMMVVNTYKERGIKFE